MKSTFMVTECHPDDTPCKLQYELARLPDSDIRAQTAKLRKLYPSLFAHTVQYKKSK